MVIPDDYSVVVDIVHDRDSLVAVLYSNCDGCVS